MPILLLTLALAPSAAIIWFVYCKDKHEKEPLKMLLIAFGLGVLSIVPALIGSSMGGQFFYVSDNALMTAIYAFGVIAFSEELGKFLFLRYVLFNKRDFNEPYDGIIYSVMISMGFATFENILYVADGGLQVAILRMFTAVPAHAVFGVMMGYWIGLAKFNPIKRNEYLLYGLFIAIVLHGAYDFFIMQQNVPALSLLSFVGLYVAIRWSKKAINQHSDNSPFKEKPYDQFRY